MSDNTELLAAIKAMQAAQQPPAPPAGAITASGIVKYQTIIIFCFMSIVGVGGWLVSNSSDATKKFVNIERDIAELKASKESIYQMKADQTKQSSDMQVLQIDMAAVKQAQKDQAAKIDSVLSAVTTIGQQVQSVAQAIRGGR